MKWMQWIFKRSKKPDPILGKEMTFNSFDECRSWNNELFDLCWERESLIVEIDKAKAQKKKSSHLIAELAKNTQRRLEIETAHVGR